MSKLCLYLHLYSKDRERASYGPFLQLLSAEKLSAITILELLRQNGGGGIGEGVKTTRAVLSIGKSVENEYNSEQLKKRRNRFAVQYMFIFWYYINVRYSRSFLFQFTYIIVQQRFKRS